MCKVLTVLRALLGQQVVLERASLWDRWAVCLEFQARTCNWLRAMAVMAALAVATSQQAKRSQSHDRLVLLAAMVGWADKCRFKAILRPQATSLPHQGKVDWEARAVQAFQAVALALFAFHRPRPMVRMGHRLRAGK